MINTKLKTTILGLALAAGLAPAAMAATPGAMPGSGTARVWFLRPSSLVNPAAGAAPTVYANGSPLGAIPANATFYRDLSPGTYRFSVETYGLPTGDADTVTLQPGSQTYLEVQWAATWEKGYPGGVGNDSHSFFVLNLSPGLAQAYLPTLTNLGQN
jgi:hypothetical protein